ncbi:MAG: phosphomannomutase CpsG [Methylococcales symbiont of Hymedesmia sp. n. MRB-2018]|nr:MAG: phosphomannomutase CpsG [Methylococcales symbiont of Hymedesmia sp. n. MRB-2018]KAF3982709.1 MAG: phosphomannomutase CpsG [Methylococcales symbiont of Hymedesmia sp. n. MRB-2018]
MKKQLSCFKAYDIRGELDVELDNDVAYRIGRAFARSLKLKSAVVGGDVRKTSESLKMSLAQGLQDEGCDVIDIGMVGTEEIYFATSHLSVDGGVEITASHNPINYNGMKLVRENSKPVSADTGLKKIQELAEQQPWLNETTRTIKSQGLYSTTSILDAFVQHLLCYINIENIKPLKLVVNSGNGAAGHVIDAIEKQFKSLSIAIEFIKVQHQPDASFPNGIPNPLLPENRSDTSNKVKQVNADFGIAWDGDFDRCFLFDEKGDFIEGYYIVGLLANVFLKKQANAKIIHDPRLTWNTQEIIEQAGGTAIMSKTGHAFIKERMRKEDAIYGGEMSAHHYFKDFFYCDSGMIPWLLIAELVCVQNKTLSSMVTERINKFPSSGEINSQLADPQAAIDRVLKKYKEDAIHIDMTDGIGVEFSDWRFNLRTSNTEPVVRLNVESRSNVQLMKSKTSELLELLRQ